MREVSGSDFERKLKYERDSIAEERYATAIARLGKVFVEAAVERLIREEAGCKL